MDKRFMGTGVAIITPFKNQKIDFEGLSNIIEHVIEGGVNYIVALGSTGEAAVLSEEESKEVLDFIIKQVNKRLPIVAGNFAGIDTSHICQKIEGYDFSGIDALLISSPAYVKPSQEGIFQHYMAIEKVSPVPIILYNVPGRTMSNINWDTTVRLANASSKIIGIKEASGDLSQTAKIINKKPEDFFVVSGDDETALGLVSVGGHGVISVIANAYPKTFSSMIANALKGDYSSAQKENLKLFDLHHWMYVEGNPVGVKSAAQLLNLCGNDVRLPLTKMSDNAYSSLQECMTNIID